jgi:hypothetical protein
MNTGTMAAREAGNMVDLDSDPTKLIEVVEIGKQLLITRGALTTFSIANDVAKYFAIIPAMFVAFYPQLQSLNIMNLAAPQSAILSAIIFNALIIVALIPLALRGVAYRPFGAASILRRNLVVYGLGGIIVPFIGIEQFGGVELWSHVEGSRRSGERRFRSAGGDQSLRQNSGRSRHHVGKRPRSRYYACRRSVPDTMGRRGARLAGGSTPSPRRRQYGWAYRRHNGRTARQCAKTQPRARQAR